MCTIVLIQYIISVKDRYEIFAPRMNSFLMSILNQGLF